MKNVAVFYHKADLDGLMSGVIAKYYLTPRFNTVSLIPINYNDDFEAALPHPASFYEDIYIIDVSDATFMEKYGSKIIYIDHHKWAMDTMPKVKDRHCIDGVAACRLAFDYLAGGPDYVFHNKEHFVDRVNPLEPLCVAILGEFDIWDKTSPLAEKLNYGQDLRFNSVEFLFNQTKGICVGDVGELLGPANKKMDVDFLERSKNISELYRDFSYLHYIVTKGEGAIEYVKTAVERIKPKKITINGHEGDEDQFVMTWHLNNEDKNPSCSFRSSKIDVSQIARQYGGGGHKAAAACRMSLSQLFEIIRPEF
jgi:oligoribonuclease NrnB/cAMP/cGMP phosphodiesterase (DHH superfamily)